MIKNRENITSVKSKIEVFLNSISEMLTALEQTKIASEQIKEAADLSYKNVNESKTSASTLLNTVKEMNSLINGMSEFSLSLRNKAEGSKDED